MLKSLKYFSFVTCLSVTTANAQTLLMTAQRSLVNTPQVELAKLAVGVQANALQLIESNYLPSLSLGAGIGREDSHNASTKASSGGSEELERRETSVTLSQMLFDGFDTHWRQSGQEVRIEAARTQLQQSAVEQVMLAIEAHLTVIEKRKALDLNLANYRAHEHIAEGIRARVESGKDDRAKVSQVEARLALSLANTETAKAELLQAQSRFFEVVGEPAASSLVDPVALPPLPKSLEAYREQVLGGNLALKEAALAKEAALKQARASHSTRYPELFFDAGASWNDNLDGVKERNNDAYAMFRLRYDLYKGGELSAERERSQLERQQASFEYDRTLRELISQAEQLWAQLHATRQQEGYLDTYVNSAQATKEAYQKQFNIGQRSLIDLLDAENELLMAYERQLGVMKELFLRHYQLMALRGDLLEKLSLTVASSASDG